MLETNKSFVSHQGRATIRCPHCKNIKQVNVSRLRGKKHRVKLRCSCGSTSLIQLDFRQNYRKKTNLKGTYHLKSAIGSGRAMIIDLSKNGIGFTVSGDIHIIQPGQKAVIDFVLDNRKKTRLKKEVIIRSVNRNRVGGEFSGLQPFEKDFGFYLQP
ncbi:MAG: hypothetical protein CSA26_08840 [Desulfobacterales bacterium]|nr:MAG: hypothetical protein CSA26_08840 [Desulfobacterales bacterium]